MMLRRIAITTSISALLLTLSACISGGGSQVAEGGIGGTGITQGSITGFGSIWVNGVEFNTNNTNIDRDGIASTQGDLGIGMIVTIEGTVNADGISGTATKVSYGKTLEGPISAKPNNNTLIVLGQTVIVDNLTRLNISGINAPTINDININDLIEVSGYSDANGSLRATYIEAKQAGSEYELNGTITLVNGNIVSVGAQNIDISGATINGFGGQSPAAGDFVEIKGHSFSGATLVATAIEHKSSGLGISDAEHVEVQGFITTFTSANDFMVGTQAVQTTAQTNIDGGVATDIRAGIKVEVEGALVGGTIIASKVKLEDSIELGADIASVDLINQTLTLIGFNGITITVNDVLTEYGGVGSFSGITAGSHITVRGRQYDQAGCPIPCVLATEVNVENSKPDLMLRGEVDTTPIDPLITVMGLTIDTTPIQDGNFGGDGISNRTTFFNTVKKGDLVGVSGLLTGGNAVWESIELDN